MNGHEIMPQFGSGNTVRAMVDPFRSLEGVFLDAEYATRAALACYCHLTTRSVQSVWCFLQFPSSRHSGSSSCYGRSNQRDLHAHESRSDAVKMLQKEFQRQALPEKRTPQRDHSIVNTNVTTGVVGAGKRGRSYPRQLDRNGRKRQQRRHPAQKTSCIRNTRRNELHGNTSNGIKELDPLVRSIAFFTHPVFVCQLLVPEGC